jgi:hypothetical protein
MLQERNNDQELLVTAGFYEAFTAASAIRALNQVGFPDDDIGMVGLLAGPPTSLVCFCEAIGVPQEHASYYSNSFEDGGILLIVRTRKLSMKEAALAILNEKGGILPPTIQ